MILLMKRERRQQTGDAHARGVGGRLAASPKTVPATLVTAPSDDALTERDLDVLELLEARLSHQEIAACLVISVSAVERHAASTYRKLRLVDSRPAVRAANTLSLQPRCTGRHGVGPAPRVVLMPGPLLRYPKPLGHGDNGLRLVPRLPVPLRGSARGVSPRGPALGLTSHELAAIRLLVGRPPGTTSSRDEIDEMCVH